MNHRQRARGPRWMLLPIETKVRELHGKCLLAAIATQSGIGVVLGDQRVLSRALHQLPLGVYVDKSASRTRTQFYRRLKSMGFGVVAWCEEGLVYRDKHAYQIERVSERSMKYTDVFFAWGEQQRADVLEVVPAAAGRIFNVGNPRFDVLKPAYRALFKKEVEQLRRRYGRFVLVNSNFSRFNHFRGETNVLETLRQRGVIKSVADETYYRGLRRHLGELFEGFAAVVPLLARGFPDVTFVLRPHPSEDHNRWRELMSNLPNVTVIHEGSVVPWILAAEAVVHNCCTTGVEAFLLGRRTIDFAPVTNAEYDSVLPRALSEIAHSSTELLGLLAQTLSNGDVKRRDSPDRQELLARYVASASQDTLASECIISILQSATAGEATPSRALRVARWLACCAFGLRVLAVNAARRLKRDGIMKAYTDQKFPGLSLDEVRKVMDAIAMARGTVPPQVSAHSTLPSCYVISPSIVRVESGRETLR